MSYELSVFIARMSNCRPLFDGISLKMKSTFCKSLKIVHFRQDFLAFLKRSKIRDTVSVLSIFQLSISLLAILLTKTTHLRATMSSSSLLLSSPAEIQFAIMERCKGEDLFNATSTCSHLKKVCNQDRLWKLICKREFGLTSDQVRKPSHDNICWKCYYQERKVLEDKDAIKWHSLAESDSRREPKPRYAHSATAANGQIFVIGGEIRSESRYDDIHVFDPATMTFSKSLNHVIPQPLSRHQSCAVGNKIYVFGGFDGVSRFNEMSVFNVAMNWWYRVETRGDIPAPRSNHACAVVGTNIYLFGGNNTSPEGRYRVLDDFYSFDTMTLTWKCLTASKCGDFPTSRSGHALVPFGNKLLLFGGGVWDDGSAQWVHKYNHVYLYDTVHGDWQRADTRGDVTVCTFPSTARLGHYHLLVFGGQSTKNNWTTNELFVLDTVSMTWKDFNRDDRPLCRDMATLSYFRSRVNPMADKHSADRFFDEPRPYYILFGGNHGGPVNDSLLLVVDKRISDPTDVQPTVHNCATSVM